MRVIMMGTGPFAVPTFRWLLESEHEVAALVTRPVPAARGRVKSPVNPMRDVAAAQGDVEIFAPESINAVESRARLDRWQADLLVVCDYGQILSRETLATARWGGINLHASLLPQYRGAAPIQWALYHGEAETGVTVIQMSPQLDAGPCLRQLRVAIQEQETGIDLEQRLARLGVDAVRDAMDWLAQHPNALGSTPQDESLASRAPRLTKSDAVVDWTRSALQIRNQVRAFQPWPGTVTDWVRAGQPPLRIILDRVSLASEERSLGPPGEVSPPGQIVALAGASHEGGILVQTGAGRLSIDRLHPAGKREMAAVEFQRGYRPAVGDRWGGEP